MTEYCGRGGPEGLWSGIASNSYGLIFQRCKPNAYKNYHYTLNTPRNKHKYLIYRP